MTDYRGHYHYNYDYNNHYSYHPVTNRKAAVQRCCVRAAGNLFLGPIGNGKGRRRQGGRAPGRYLFRSLTHLGRG